MDPRIPTGSAPQAEIFKVLSNKNTISIVFLIKNTDFLAAGAHRTLSLRCPCAPAKLNYFGVLNFFSESRAAPPPCYVNQKFETQRPNLR